MKKCPTCDKEFDDSMRFCQIDGTPLVEDAAVFDPYATMIAAPGVPIVPIEGEPAEEMTADAAFSQREEVHQTVGSMPIGEPDDVLDLPEADPLKTMYVSEAEMKAAMGGDGPRDEPEIIEMPPMGDPPKSEPEIDEPPASEPEVKEPPAPEPPSFNVPEVSTPNFGAASPPPSPFSVIGDQSVSPPPMFDDPPSRAAYDEQETVVQGFNSPLDPPPAPMADWTPPAPDASWQNQAVGSNTPFQSPASVGGENKTLPIVSLVLGVMSLCCYVSPITGIAALITGFLGMKNANSDPANYGGKGLAIAGMITGGLFLVIGIVYWVISLGGFAMIMDAAR